MKTNDLKLKEVELAYKKNRNLSIATILYFFIILTGLYVGVLPISPQDPLVFIYAGPALVFLVKIAGMSPQKLFGVNTPEQEAN